MGVFNQGSILIERQTQKCFSKFQSDSFDIKDAPCFQRLVGANDGKTMVFTTPENDRRN